MKLSQSLVILVAATNLWAATKIVNLEEARKDLVLPNYTSEERETLADQAKLLLNELFVHRDLKVNHFGTSSDPLPKVEALKEKAPSLSNQELHGGLSRAFLELHDLHTNYIAPKPFACGLLFVPLRFETVTEKGKPMVVVSRKLKLKGDLVADVNLKDQLVSYNNVPVEQMISSLGSLSGGANADAMRTRSVQLLSLRSLSMADSLPKENIVKLQLKNSDDKTYEKEIAWQSLFDPECVNENGDRNRSRNPKRDFNESLRMGSDDFQKKYNKIFGQPTLVSEDLLTASDEEMAEIFEAAALSTPGGKIGYVKLKQFSWDNKSIDVATVIDAFRRTVEVTFAETKGLVIDVRGNPGGNIVFAEKLVQFFSTHLVEPSQVTMLANPLNEQIFIKANGTDNRWSKALQSAIENKERYMKPLAITPANEANGFGQIWYRPTVVLTDANCYSACDIFTAGMQDMGAATIIGIHKNTGAGGANVMEHKTFRMILGEDNAQNPFKKLPYGQNMRVAWRQCIRSGKHRGELIEDKGVVSDIVVPLKLDDIGLESKELMRQVLKSVNALLPLYKSGMEPRTAGVVLLKNGTSPSWKEKVYGVDRVDVLVDDRLLSSHSVSYSDTAKEVDLDAGSLKGDWFDEAVTLVGYKGNEQVFRTVRELKWRGDYLSVPATEGLTLNFNDGKLGDLKTVLLKGPNNSGWTVVDGKLRVGKGPHYESRVYARAFLPLELKGEGGFLKLDLSVEAEDLQDSFRLYLVNPDTGARRNVFAGSELPPIEGARVRLPKGWDKADLVFEFESDENWNMTGPLLDNISITQ